VIETTSGFHVLKRTAAHERTRLAMSVISLLHTGSQFHRIDARATRTEDEARTSAHTLLAELKAHPGRFPRRQAERCELAYCTGIYAFDEGRGPPAAERALRQRKLGELYPEPLATPFGIVVLRREDPALAPKPTPSAPTTEFGPHAAPSAFGTDQARAPSLAAALSSDEAR
jgi:hypothetical protein